MPVLINQQSGFAEDLPKDQADQALAQGTHALPLNDPNGNPVIAPAEGASDLLSQGYTQPNTQQLQALLDSAKFGTPTEQLKTAAEHAASSATFGLSTKAETALGVDPKDILSRSEENPKAAMAGDVAGLLIPGAPEATILKEVGEGAKALTGLGKEGAGILSHVAAGAVKAVPETALFAAGDENSKFIAGDPNQSAETALTNIGLSGLFGAATGGAFGAVSPLFKAANESKLGQFIEDFKSQLKNRMDNPNPVENLTKELQDHYNTIKGMADEVYGASGLKAQEIQKLMPEMGPKITEQVGTLADRVSNAVQDLKDDPYVGKLQNAAEKWRAAVTAAENDPAKIFDATQKFKQQLQEWGKFNKTFVPLAEKDFRETAKSLGFEMRTALENPEVWGQAADRQQAINSAFKEYLPTLKDFEKKFTTEINGERVIDPTKVNTYANQLGKPQAEIKQQMVHNFLDASEKYRGVIDKTHANLGIESPFQATSLNSVKATLNKVTPGAKLANALVDKGLARLGGEALGTGVGAAAGHLVGSPWLGAILGEHALGPVFSSVLPAIVKPILEKPASVEGFVTASKLGTAIVNGEAALSKAAKAVFTPGAHAISESMVASDKTREKLKQKLDAYQTDTASLLNVGGTTGHYMPDHGATLAAVAARAVNYLNTLKPSEDRLGPLDPKRTPSDVEVAKYNRALDIAEQPLTAIQHIKDGNLTPDDVTTFKTIYPSLYDRVSQKLTKEMIEHTAKGNSVPYTARLGMSLFLGQALDSTMTPQSIAAAQPMPKMPPEQPQGAQSQQGGAHSMKAIADIGNMFKTPGQSRESRRGSRA